MIIGGSGLGGIGLLGGSFGERVGGFGLLVGGGGGVGRNVGGGGRRVGRNVGGGCIVGGICQNKF